MDERPLKPSLRSIKYWRKVFKNLLGFLKWLKMAKKTFKNDSELKNLILKEVEGAEKPLSVDAVRARVQMGSWYRALNLLLELAQERKIIAIRTSRGWIFAKPEAVRKVVGME
jgi:hypothetical protein